MNSQISISIWVFILLLLVTGWAILDRVFIPSVRWFLRRRINRVIDEIGYRLDIEIKPFQLTKRQILIDRLIYDPKVIKARSQKLRQLDGRLQTLFKRDLIGEKATIIVEKTNPTQGRTERYFIQESPNTTAKKGDLLEVTVS